MDSSQTILWQPGAEDIKNSVLTRYRDWLTRQSGLTFSGYEKLWEWSVEEPEKFWESIVRFFGVKFHAPYGSVISGGEMPDTLWFEGGTLNYAEHIFLGMKGQQTAILFSRENGQDISISVAEMWREVARFQAYYKAHGVVAGDRIAGYLPNIPQATFAFIAAVSLGAVWSCCSPDFGVSSVTDRFVQIEPKLFIAADGYEYNGKRHERLEEIRAIQSALPGLKNTLIVEYIGTKHASEDQVTWLDSLPYTDHEVIFDPVPFNHPLWILYSSGTTGAPKAITHSHGGCLLEHLKYLAFHNDVHAGERFFWFTTTGWMMWNFLNGSMLLGATMILYDGSPAYPNLNRLWEMASGKSLNHFGTSAPFIVACMKEGLSPGAQFDLTCLRSIGSTGSPLPPEAFTWVYQAIHPRVWLCSMSGGTDVCTAFVGGVIEKPVYEGEIQCRGLGCALYAFNDLQQSVTDELGEMVITKPMPSMPIYFWNDPGKERYHSSYFEDIPGVWRHGDWVKITKEGGVVIYGRSDATLNRQGIRIGTAEIYSVLNGLSAIDDALIVNLELDGGRHYMPLFVKLKNKGMLDESLAREIRTALKTKCSPRHVPDDIFQVADIPYTISGKKMEAPVKKILLGMDVAQTLNKDAMRNPGSLEFFRLFKVPPA